MLQKKHIAREKFFWGIKEPWGTRSAAWSRGKFTWLTSLRPMAGRKPSMDGDGPGSGCQLILRGTQSWLSMPTSFLASEFLEKQGRFFEPLVSEMWDPRRHCGGKKLESRTVFYCERFFCQKKETTAENCEVIIWELCCVKIFQERNLSTVRLQNLKLENCLHHSGLKGRN